MECVFCKIIHGELPCYKVYEDKRMIAFLDINPVNKGHLLLVPKDHYLNILDAPVDILKDLITCVQKLAKVLSEAVGSPGFNLGVNNGKSAGQAVEHLHFHIMPRFENDNLYLWPGKTLSEEEMIRISENIRKLL